LEEGRDGTNGYFRLVTSYFQNYVPAINMIYHAEFLSKPISAFIDSTIISKVEICWKKNKLCRIKTRTPTRRVPAPTLQIAALFKVAILHCWNAVKVPELFSFFFRCTRNLNLEKF